MRPIQRERTSFFKTRCVATQAISDHWDAHVRAVLSCRNHLLLQRDRPQQLRGALTAHPRDDISPDCASRSCLEGTRDLLACEYLLYAPNQGCFGGWPALISIVLAALAASAGFLTVTWRTPLSKCASTAPSAGVNGKDIER